MRKRQLIPGVQTRGPRPDAASSGRSKKITVQCRGWSRHVMRAVLFGRSNVDRFVRKRVRELAAHYYGEDMPPLPKVALLEIEAKLYAIARLAYADLMQDGLIKDGALHVSFEPFMRATKEQRAVLALLGLEHRVRELDINDILRAENAPAARGDDEAA